MMRFVVVLLLIGLLVLLPIACYWFWVAPSSYNYRITVTVDTPSGEFSGSTVRKITYSRQPKLTPESGSRTIKEYGDAVVVDLPDGEKLFVLLSGATEMVWSSFLQGDKSKNKEIPNILRDVNISRKTFKLVNRPYLSFPMMMVFEDTDKPATAKLVSLENFSEILGEGYALKGISVVMTDDPVVYSIHKELDWLELYSKKQMGLNGSTGNISAKDPAGNRGASDFQWKDEK